MNSGHSMNGAVAAGGTIQLGDVPALEPGPAPYVQPHPLGAVPAHAAFPAASPIPVPAPKTHTLPSGHTVSFASPRILTRGQRHRLIEIDNGYPTVNAILTWLVTDWSYPFPIPSADAASLDLIPGEDEDALTVLAWPPVQALLFPKAPTPDDHADETSPTAPSGA
jgi:hypothetical protein